MTPLPDIITRLEGAEEGSRKLAEHFFRGSDDELNNLAGEIQDAVERWSFVREHMLGKSREVEPEDRTDG